jgi:osmoprotectant transport system permease protein
VVLLLLAFFGALAVFEPRLRQSAAAAPPAITIASKSFTESVILGEIAAQAGSARGLATSHRRALGGTRLVWDALLAGDVDVYPDYTGTLVEEILAQQSPPPASGASRAWLRAQLSARGVGLVGPLGFDNTYAIGMREAVAERWHVRRISDLARVPQLALGFSNEFMSRNDGWPKLRARYGLTTAQATGIDHDLAYRALEGGSIHATDLYSTDAEIAHYGLRVLEDDLHVFPRYEAVYLYRLAREQALAPLLSALASVRIDATRMRALNARVKLGKESESAEATDFVRDELGLAARAREQTRWSAIAQHTGEHLALVLVALLCAIAAALPLGVLCHRRPRLGRVVLDAVGLVQTIPSLALLVFMIPLLGIGALPAGVALFLYSLLPIVRNTYTGLCDVPPQLRTAAAALGLPPRAVLRLVELPIASRAILAGIKSAAVICVGTATLGALIGAGGLGQPILTGIRLDDFGLILQGAVPASLLAIGVERGFDLLERVLVPRGLRLER